MSRAAAKTDAVRSRSGGPAAATGTSGLAAPVGPSHPARREGEGGGRIDPARQVAFETLLAVVAGDSFLHVLLPPLLRSHGLFGSDAAWTTELVYGTSRLRGRYDAIIALAAQEELPELDERTIVLLRLGCHEFLALKVPCDRSIPELAALARAVGGRVDVLDDMLHQIGAHPVESWLDRIARQSKTEEERLARVHSHPQWIVRALREALAGDAHELPELLEANNRPAPLTLAMRPGLVRLAELPGTSRATYAATARILDCGDPAALSVVREGLVGVQDEGSQLATLAFAHAPIDGPDRTWLDLCSGRGEKAALLASWIAARTPGADRTDTGTPPRGADVRPRTRRLVVNDLFQHRTDLAARALTAIPEAIDVQVRTGDGRVIGEQEPERYDRVLVNAPSTGLGELRRRPEARWRRKTADLGAVAEDQRALTLSAIAATRIGGIVGYLVCSPHSAETTFVVADVIKRAAKAGNPVEPVDAAAVLGVVAANELPDLTGPYVQLWPHRHGTDAVFLALLRRVEQSA